jgi:hypothetical protein
VTRIVFSKVMWVGRATIFMAGLAVMTALLIGVLAATKPAHAETITVDTTSNDPTLTDKCTLEGAITAANTNTEYNACPAGDLSSVARDTIAFNIPLTDPGCNATSGVCTISPRPGIYNGLPDITETVTIDGYTQPGARANTKAVGNDAVLKIELDGLGSFTRGLSLGAYAPDSVVRGLVINRFSHTGISITGTGNEIEGNFIGTDPTGMLDEGNGYTGVDISRGPDIPGRDNSGSDNTIGGTTPDARNVISGNGIWGVSVFGYTNGAATGNKIEGNFIGTTKNGSGNLGNSSEGVYLAGASTSTMGDSDPSDGLSNAANTIAFNGSHGVSLGTLGTGTDPQGNPTSISSTGNRILSNSMFSNSGLGINLNDGLAPNDDQDPDTGSNNRQNYPVINSAKTKGSRTTIKGTLNSTANTTFTIQFFSSPKSTKEEGKKFKGQLTGERSVTTDPQGNASFSIRVPKASGFVTATATNDATGDTSEFSLPKRVVLLQ